MQDFEIRDVTDGDLKHVVAVQVASWRNSYRGLLPDDFLDTGVVTTLEKRWHSHPGPDWLVLMAWRGDAPLGFVAVDRKKGPGSYVDNLHVLEAAQGLGVGRALMAEAARRLSAEGVERLWLTVMVENPKARAFYKRIGGTEGAHQQEYLYDHLVNSIPVVWDDLPKLAQSVEV